MSSKMGRNPFQQKKAPATAASPARPRAGANASPGWIAQVLSTLAAQGALLGLKTLALARSTLSS